MRSLQSSIDLLFLRSATSGLKVCPKTKILFDLCFSTLLKVFMIFSNKNFGTDSFTALPDSIVLGVNPNS